MTTSVRHTNWTGIPPSFFPEVDEWLDIEDQSFIEHVKVTGKIDTVCSWPELTSRRSCEPSVFVSGDSWEWAEQHSQRADRTNSAFLTDELIAIRANQRALTAKLIEEAELEERIRRERQRRAKRAERARAERAAIKRYEEMRPLREASEKAREYAETIRLTYAINSVLINSSGNEKWSIEKLSAALNGDVRIVRRIVDQMLREGRVTI
jgi:hypothetical protein